MTSSPVSSAGEATKSPSAESALSTGAPFRSISIHTVKNNLQVLYSLCSLHGRSISDEAALAAFSRIRGGLLLLSDAYDLLHRSEHGDLISLGSFLPRVISRIAALHLIGNVPLRATASIPDLPIPFATAVSWAMLLNEVIAYLASCLTQESHSLELSATGMLTDSTLTIAFTSPAGFGVNNTDSPAGTAPRTADLGGVGTALLRQCEATAIWTIQNPSTLEVVFFLPVLHPVG